MNAPTAVIASTIVITGTSAIKDVKEGKPPIVPIVSGFLLGSALLLLAIASPALAKAFALLGLVGAMVTNGGAVMDIVGGIIP
jgi:hypothetical protein